MATRGVVFKKIETHLLELILDIGSVFRRMKIYNAWNEVAIGDPGIRRWVNQTLN